MTARRRAGCAAPSDDLETVNDYEYGLYDAMKGEHKRTAHAMALNGGMYRCGKGHRVEAHPADAMRAAGQEPML